MQSDTTQTISSNESFYQEASNFMDLPDTDGGDFDIEVWAVEPGDAVVFNFKTLHGANANTLPAVNQTVSFRLVGDDARYVQRPGRTSPNFPDINQRNGERSRVDRFPQIWPRTPVTDF